MCRGLTVTDVPVVCALTAPDSQVDGEILGGAQVLPRGDQGALDGVRGTAVDHVVIVAERRDETLALRHAAVLADLGRHVAVRTLPHGPAAVLLLALEAARLRADPGVVVGWLDAAAARTWSGAWTPSVSRLDDPAPSLGQHLASYTPGGRGFVVNLAGAHGPAVVRGGAVPEPLAPGLRPVLHLTVDGLGAEQTADLLKAASARQAEVLPFPAGAPADRFGNARAVEGVALPASPRSLMPTTAYGDCTVCGAALVAAFCPFCHVRPVAHDSLVPGGSS